MRWLVASVAAVVVLLLTFPVLAVGSSDGPGECLSAVGFRTLGNSENCDTVGVAVSLPAAAFAFVLVAWAWRHLRARGVDPTSSESSH
jgi:hypothetical protein